MSGHLEVQIVQAPYLVTLSGQDYGYRAHDRAEYDRLMGLEPTMRNHTIGVLLDMTGANFDPYVYSGRRTLAEQVRLYRLGRTKTLLSKHRLGLAVDIASRATGWGASEAFWSKLAECGRQHGLYSGRGWKKFHPVHGDAAHLEDRGGKTLPL